MVDKRSGSVVSGNTVDAIWYRDLEEAFLPRVENKAFVTRRKKSLRQLFLASIAVLRRRRNRVCA